MCSSKFCKISKYTFSYRTLPVAASVISVVRLIKTEGSAIHWFSKEDYENLENAQENIRGWVWFYKTRFHKECILESCFKTFLNKLN